MNRFLRHDLLSVAVVILWGLLSIASCDSSSRRAAMLDGLRIIDTDAFSGCEQLMLLQGTLSALEKLGSNAFKDCRSLPSVPSAGHIKTVPEACFSGCSNLESFTLPEDLEMIEPFAFYQSGSGDGSLIRQIRSKNRPLIHN